MAVDAPDDDEFDECANCNSLVDTGDAHPRVTVRRNVTANDVERVECHFCSDDCLDEWTGAFPG